MATPEYGKWTKTGGLGVMTDELARGLAELGQTVYTITPWYEIKNKAKPKMLEEDGIKYIKNLEIQIGPEKKIVGVHYGYVLGHHLYFLHNPELFYEPFGGDDPAYIMKGLVLYAKCVLQLLCDLNLKPELIITNDWFSGLI